MSIASGILRLMGWKIEGKIPTDLKKFVVIAAPHTSMWDFVIGFFTFQSLGIEANYLIKKEMFFFPMSIILKKLGGIAVDRKNNSLVEELTKLYNERDYMVIAITPEATRSAVLHWKSGFHRIAHSANVPVVAGFLDYKKKVAGIIGIIDLSHDFENDLKKIQSLYKGVTAKHPEKFILPAD